MRLISPALPGTAFMVGAVSEVGLLVTQAQAATSTLGIPVWLQVLPLGLVVGVGSWGIIRLFQHERDTASRFEASEKKWQDRFEASEEKWHERFAALETKWEERGERQHRDNLDRMERIDDRLKPLDFLIMGIQGEGSYSEERKLNRDRRHEFAGHLTNIYALLHTYGAWAARVGEKVTPREPFSPLPMPTGPHRRMGDE
jgi:ABC-type nickel/cobalt efflux system permease component RcnA